MSQSKRDAISQFVVRRCGKINHDQDYWFQLRGDNPNVLIDAATPLFGFLCGFAPSRNARTLNRSTVRRLKRSKRLKLS